MNFNRKNVKNYNIFTSICIGIFIVVVVLDIINKEYGSTYYGYPVGFIFFGLVFLGYALYSLEKKRFVIAGIALMSISALGYILIVLSRNGII